MSGARGGRRRGHAAAYLALVFAVYTPALGGAFVWDDHSILPNNPLMHGAGGLRDIWTTTGRIPDETHYWPVTYTVLWLQHRLWGLAPLGYHVVNVVLHGVIGLFVVGLVGRLGLAGGWLAALLFALHPVHVEAVAWIDELKDLLATLGYLAAAELFLAGERRLRTGMAAAAILAIALLAKSSAVTLPLALGLALWYRQGRLERRDLVALAPVVLMAVALGTVDTAITTAHPREQGASAPPLVERALHAGRALWFQAGKLVWPSPLSVIYPGWNLPPASPTSWLPLAAAVGVTAGLWKLQHRLGRGPFAAWAFYGLSLGPTLGLVHFSFLELSPAADRYQYLASLGPIVAGASVTAAWIARAGGRGGRRRAAPVGLVLLVLAIMTWRQAGLYRDQATLFAHALSVAPDSYMATSNYAAGLMLQGRHEEAREPLQKAVAQNPRDKASFTNLGMIHLGSGRLEEARESFEAALAVDPGHVPALSRLGVVLIRQEQLEEAARVLEALVEQAPQEPGALGNLAYVVGRLGDVDRQVDLYRRALAASGAGDEDLASNLAWVLAARGRPEETAEALTLARRAVEAAGTADPPPRHLNTLALALLANGRPAEAADAARRALLLARAAGTEDVAGQSLELLQLADRARRETR